MEVGNLLSLEQTRCGTRVTSKKRALQLLGELLAADQDSEVAKAVFEGLTLRERLGSTGLGRGVALPHSRSADIDQPRAALLRLETAIDFDAADGQPVDLLFALLVPEHSNDEHLRILSRLAEMFRDQALCNRLRDCGGDADLFQTFTGWSPASDGS